MKPRHFIAALLSLPVIYVLSIGPLEGIAYRYPERTFNEVQIIYGPLITLAVRFPQFHKILNWYVAPWLPKRV
jgi:hypothetical protein